MNKDTLVNSIETAGNRSKQKSGILSRYTTWQKFYCWLESNKIIFGNYTHWEDESDVAILDAYAKHINKQIRVICFMENSADYQDCYYHWKNYANGDDGMRIDFYKSMLVNALKSDENVKIYGDCVEYPSKSEIKNLVKISQNIPFIKRAAYKGDREFRFLCLGNPSVVKKDHNYEYSVEEGFFEKCIKSIRFNSSMPAEKFLEIRSILKEKGVIKNVHFSRVLRYERWENIVLSGINDLTKIVSK